jgi:hypothetical protein
MSRKAVRPYQLPIQWVPGFSPGVTGRKSEVNHTPPSNAEINNEWKYTSTPQYAFMV